MQRFLLAPVFLISVTLRLTAQTISGVINIYTPVTGVDFCNNNVVVTSVVGFSVGDKVMLIQMGGADIDLTETAAYGNINSYANAGNYELFTIGDVNFNIITFTETMTRRYDAINGRVQLVSVPEYTDVSINGTITATAWNGSQGGIVAFIATGTVTFNANVDVSNLGFRGGDNYSHDLCYASTGNYDGYACSEVEYCGSRKGEGIGISLGTDSLGRGAPANGGGGGNDSNTGGGGGSNYGTGGVGGMRLNVPAGECAGNYPGIGGKSLIYSNAENKIFMGGGGGSGDENEFDGTSGSPGGGIVFIRANQINGNNYSIKANGKPVYAVAGKDAAGGGGAAGTILLDVPAFSSVLNVEINGGDGGDVDNNLDGTNCLGPGGGGGGGALWISNGALPVNLNYSALGGPAGSTINPDAPIACNGLSNGALAGNAGGLITGLVVTEPSTIFIPLTLNVSPDDTVLCQGQTLDITTTATGTGTLTYLWNDAAASTGTDISVIPSNDFTYQVTITDSRGCQITKAIEVTVIDSVIVAAYPDSTIVQGDFVTLATNLNTTYTFSWTPADESLNDPTIPSPLAEPLSTTTYCVTVTEQQSGCISSGCVEITVVPDVVIPNAFTPNGDGVNDFFHIPDLGILCNAVTFFRIYDRWGKVVYDYTLQPDGLGWDGTDYQTNLPLPIGTYVYLIKLQCSETERIFASDVILLR